MARKRRLRRKIIRTILPITILLIGTILGIMIWIIYGVTHIPQRAYLVTPEKFLRLSSKGVRVTDEIWRNDDGTQAQGWLLKGTEGNPAIVMLHHYGADRSWLLNLGVKINEDTNFTILWPDLRGHGEKPTSSWTGLGSKEVDDTLSAIDFLRSLKSANGNKLVGNNIGVYGVEMGAYIALQAASNNTEIKALVLDSIPASSNDLLNIAIDHRLGLNNSFTQALARMGLKIYFLGNYKDTTSCTAAKSLTTQKILLLSGDEAGPLKDSTIALVQCIPTSVQTEVIVNLPLTGRNLVSASGEQGEVYDRRVIDFFDRSFGH
jgi:pimeloyl-ACP methyl ester carboxylesterase